MLSGSWADYSLKTSGSAMEEMLNFGDKIWLSDVGTAKSGYWPGRGGELITS